MMDHYATSRRIPWLAVLSTHSFTAGVNRGIRKRPGDTFQNPRDKRALAPAPRLRPPARRDSPLRTLQSHPLSKCRLLVPKNKTPRAVTKNIAFSQIADATTVSGSLMQKGFPQRHTAREAASVLEGPRRAQ